MAEREKIFKGDTFPITMEVRRPDESSSYNTEGIPAQPDRAFARVVEGQTSQFLQLGGPGILEVPVAIIPMTSTKGALLKYTVPKGFTQTPGDYILLISAVWGVGADELIVTEDRRYRVLDYR